MTDVMAKVQQVKYQMPHEAQRPGHPEVDRRDHRRHVYRLLQPELTGAGDHRLPDPRRAAAARDRRRRGLGRDPGRPDLRDAALARPRPDGGARHLGRRGARRRSAPTTSSRRPARRRATSPSPTSSPTPASTDLDGVPRHGGQGRGRRRWCGCDDVATVELGAQSSELVGQHERPAGRVHRRQRDADRQPADASSKGVRELMPDDPARPAADGARCRSSTIRPGSSRPRSTRSSARWSRRWRSSSSVIFLFLGSFRSVLIPVVTIPLSIDRRLAC